MSATKYDTLINQLECPVGLSLYASAMDMRADIEKQRANAAAAIRALSADLAAAIAQAQPAAMCGCGDTFGDGSVCANCLAGIDCKPVPDDEPAVVPAGFVLARDARTLGDSESDVAYTAGWNDCRTAMIATNQQDDNA